MHLHGIMTSAQVPVPACGESLAPMLPGGKLTYLECLPVPVQLNAAVHKADQAAIEEEGAPGRVGGY